MSRPGAKFGDIYVKKLDSSPSSPAAASTAGEAAFFGPAFAVDRQQSRPKERKVVTSTRRPYRLGCINIPIIQRAAQYRASNRGAAGA